MLWADTLLTGLLLKNEDVALFTVAARLSFVSLFFLGALDATIYPRLLKIHQHQPEQGMAGPPQASEPGQPIGGGKHAVNVTVRGPRPPACPCRGP